MCVWGVSFFNVSQQTCCKITAELWVTFSEEPSPAQCLWSGQCSCETLPCVCLCASGARDEQDVQISHNTVELNLRRGSTQKHGFWNFVNVVYFKFCPKQFYLEMHTSLVFHVKPNTRIMECNRYQATVKNFEVQWGRTDNGMASVKTLLSQHECRKLPKQQRKGS